MSAPSRYSQELLTGASTLTWTLPAWEISNGSLNAALSGAPETALAAIGNCCV